MSKHRYAFGIAAALAFLPVLAHAETGAALLVDVTGTTQPALSPYSEVAPGSAIALGPDATVKFVHYQSCKEVTVAGGTLKVNGPDYTVTGGKIISETQQACPQQVKIAQTTAVAGGLVMRGVLKLTEVASHPSLVVVGAKAAAVTTVAFSDDASKETVELPVKDRRVVWAEGTPTLKAGSNYKLALLSNGKSQLEMPVRAVEDDKASVVVLHVD